MYSVSTPAYTLLNAYGLGNLWKAGLPLLLLSNFMVSKVKKFEFTQKIKIPKNFVAKEQEFTQKKNADESTLVNCS